MNLTQGFNQFRDSLLTDKVSNLWPRLTEQEWDLIYNQVISCRLDEVNNDYDRIYENGYEVGYREGYNDGEEVGRDYGYEDGHHDGYDEGYDEGYQMGFEDGLEADRDV